MVCISEYGARWKWLKPQGQRYGLTNIWCLQLVPLAVLRKGVGEALLWLKAAQDQDKGRGHLLTIPVTALGRQGSPWQIPRYWELAA